MGRHVANFVHHGRRRRWRLLRVVRSVHSGFVLVAHHVDRGWTWRAAVGWWRRLLLLAVPRVKLTALVQLVHGVVGVALWTDVRWGRVHHGRRRRMHLLEGWRRRRMATTGICMGMVSSAVHRPVVRHGRHRRMADVVVAVRRPDEISSYVSGVNRGRLHRWGRRSGPVGHVRVEVEASSVGTVLKGRWLGWHVRVGRMLGMRRRLGWDRC